MCKWNVWSMNLISRILVLLLLSHAFFVLLENGIATYTSKDRKQKNIGNNEQWESFNKEKRERESEKESYVFIVNGWHQQNNNRTKKEHTENINLASVMELIKLNREYNSDNTAAVFSAIRKFSICKQLQIANNRLKVKKQKSHKTNDQTNENIEKSKLIKCIAKNWKNENRPLVLVWFEWEKAKLFLKQKKTK